MSEFPFGRLGVCLEGIHVLGIVATAVNAAWVEGTRLHEP